MGMGTTKLGRGLLVGVVVAGLASLTLAGCNSGKDASGPKDTGKPSDSNVSTSGLPIVKTPVTLTIAGGQNADIKKPWNDMKVFKDYKGA